MSNPTTIAELLAMPEISDEEKILFWLKEAKEAKFKYQNLRWDAQAALDAYEQRFASTTGVGNYVGPIDEEMKALRETLGKS